MSTRSRDGPAARVRAALARPPPLRPAWLPLASRSFVGDKVAKHRGVLRLSRPIRAGVVESWDDLMTVWTAAVTDKEAGLGVRFQDHPLLVTEPALNPASQREALATHAFETLGVPALFVSPQATLPLYAAGRTTGVVVDVGHGVTQVVPVYEGMALSHAVVRSDVAGDAVTARLHHLLRSAGLVLDGSSGMEVVRELKEAVCHVAADPKAAEAEAAARAAAPASSSGDSGPTYRLPDGRVFAVGPEAFRAPELLFRPTTAGIDSPGLHEALAGAVFRCDVELRRELWGSVVLAGGSTQLPGLGRRLLSESRGLAPRGTKVRIAAPANRGRLCWDGGSILASLATFRRLVITKRQWEEEGASVVHRSAI